MLPVENLEIKQSINLNLNHLKYHHTHDHCSLLASFLSPLDITLRSWDHIEYLDLYPALFTLI